MHKTVTAGIITLCSGLIIASSAAPTLTPGVWKDITPSGVNLNELYGCNDVQVDPSNPSVLYACFDEKTSQPPPALWKSTNSGETWNKIGNLDAPTHLFIDPTNTQHLYCVDGVRGDTKGFWVSTNGGTNWTVSSSYLSTVADSRINNNDLYDLSVNPTNVNHILLCFHSGWAGYKDPQNRGVDYDNAGFLESKDGGSSWRTILPRSDWRGVGYILKFLYHPASNQGNESTWLLGTQRSGFWRTTNAGESWTQVSTENMSHGGMQILYAPDKKLYISAIGCILRSSDNGATWTKITSGLPSDWTGGYYTVLCDGTNLYASPGTWIGDNKEYPMYYSPVTDGLTWRAYSEQKFKCGPYNGVYDATNKIIYSANWMQGVWAFKNPSATSIQTTTTSPAAVMAIPAYRRTVDISSGTVHIKKRDGSIFTIGGKLYRTK